MKSSEKCAHYWEHVEDIHHPEPRKPDGLTIVYKCRDCPEVLKLSPDVTDIDYSVGCGSCFCRLWCAWPAIHHGTIFQRFEGCQLIAATGYYRMLQGKSIVTTKGPVFMIEDVLFHMSALSHRYNDALEFVEARKRKDWKRADELKESFQEKEVLVPKLGGHVMKFKEFGLKYHVLGMEKLSAQITDVIESGVASKEEVTVPHSNTIWQYEFPPYAYERPPWYRRVLRWISRKLRRR